MSPSGAGAATASVLGAVAFATDAATKGLSAIREASRAALTAQRLEDALEFTLERVSPAVSASFASVFLVERETDMLRLAAAYNWPERMRPWLSEMRVQMGTGPSGQAASERRVIEVPDVFADDAFVDWREVATELGFRALIALPVSNGTTVFGATAFYFADAGGFTPFQRELVRAAADVMAMAASHTVLAERARVATTRLGDAQAEAGRQAVSALEAGRARDEFLANVSHELKTPLTIVLGTIDLLSEELGGPLTVSQREDLEQARGASERLLELVNTLLALSALRRGEVAVVSEEFDPRDALRSAASVAGSPRAGVAFTVDEPSTFVPSMRGDREKTVRVLTALLGNAFKFTERGSVTASLEVGGGRVRYQVKDTGVGIPTAALPFIFDEFRQADGSVTRRFGGSGLGLALARGLARLLDGDVTVKSAEGAGSEFVLELPVSTKAK